MAIQGMRLLDDVTTTGEGAIHSPDFASKTFQLEGSTSSGVGAAAVKVEASHSGRVGTWEEVGSITLTLGTTTTSDSFSTVSIYKHYRGNVVSISGTGAKVILSMNGI